FLFEPNRVPNALLDTIFRQQMDREHRLHLSHAVNSGDTLLEARGIPRRLYIDHGRGGLKIDSNATGVGGKENSDLWPVAKSGDELAPPPRRDTAVEGNVADFHLIEQRAQLKIHFFPFAEDHHFALFFDDQLLDDLS